MSKFCEHCLNKSGCADLKHCSALSLLDSKLTDPSLTNEEREELNSQYDLIRSQVDFSDDSETSPGLENPESMAPAKDPLNAATCENCNRKIVNLPEHYNASGGHEVYRNLDGVLFRLIPTNNEDAPFKIELLK